MKTTYLIAAALAAYTASAETVYLVNSFKGSETSSGMAYYDNNHSSANQARPQDYTDVVQGRNVHWEGETVKGEYVPRTKELG